MNSGPRSGGSEAVRGSVALICARSGSRKYGDRWQGRHGGAPAAEPMDGRSVRAKQRNHLKTRQDAGLHFSRRWYTIRAHIAAAFYSEVR